MTWKAAAKNCALYICLFSYSLVLLEIVALRLGHGAAFEFSRGNFVPLKTVFGYLSGHSAWGTAMRNMLGNIFLFAPAGLLLPMALKGKSKTALRLSLSAYGIGPEILQASLKTGIFDVDDIILNSLGVTLGYLLFIILDRRHEGNGVTGA